MRLKILLAVFLPAVVSGQSCVPFISTSDSSDTWMDINSCTDFDCYYEYTNRYNIPRDTIIGGQLYSKVYMKTKYEIGADQHEN